MSKRTSTGVMARNGAPQRLVFTWPNPDGEDVLYIRVDTFLERQARLAELFADAVRDKPDRDHWLGLWNETLG